MLQTVLWGAATVVVSLGALRAWVQYTDPIKDAHPSAWIFSSKALVQGNWGLFDLKAIFSAEVWRFWMKCWEQAIMSRWLIAAGLADGAGVARRAVARARRGRAVFFRPVPVPLRLRLPGLLLLCLRGLRARRPRVHVVGPARHPCAALADRVAPAGASSCSSGEVDAYRREYYREQSVVFSGDLPYTKALRELTPKKSVLVVAGFDWAAMTPYYAQRKALLVRNGLGV